MRTATQPKLIVILGPTASGKSKLAVFIARRFGGEIVSADSRQVYRGLDIGTGKVMGKWKLVNKKMGHNPHSLILENKRMWRKRFFYKGVRHYLIDVANPRRMFTVAQFQKLGRAAIKKIIAEGKLPIICGGTGLYIDALISGKEFSVVKPNPKLRKRFDMLTAEHLYEMLRKLDPRRAATIDRYNKRRLVRALEIVLATGKPVPPLPHENNHSDILENVGMIGSDVLKIVVRVPQDELKTRIRKRLREWLRQGLLREVEQLHANGLSWKRLDELGLTYRYVSRYLRGLITKKEMLVLLEREIWRYAKRQMTWFKRDKEIVWISYRSDAVRRVARFLR